MELLFAYAAGLLTLINPCVLPVLPIALAAAVGPDRRGPLALAAGMSLAFTAFGVAVAAAGPALGLSADGIAQAGAALMMGFGALLLTPRLNLAFATATAGLANGANRRLDRESRSGLAGPFTGGALLGAVWSPCIGPTLGGAVALASQGASLGRAAAIMAAFSLGVSTVILALAHGAGEAIRARRDRLAALAEWSKPAMGWAFLAVGTMLFFKLHHPIEAALLNLMPVWLQDLSVRL
jgi:cytochrome c biogenesis protein CcdA